MTMQVAWAVVLVAQTEGDSMAATGSSERSLCYSDVIFFRESLRIMAQN